MWKLPSTEKHIIAQVLTLGLIKELLASKNPMDSAPKSKHIKHCMMNANE